MFAEVVERIVIHQTSEMVYVTIVGAQRPRFAWFRQQQTEDA